MAQEPIVPVNITDVQAEETNVNWYADGERGSAEVLNRPIKEVAAVVNETVAEVNRLNATTITAGDGLTGGGDLSADRTVSLGTPGTLSGNTTNAVTAESHTHEISDATETVAGVVELATNAEVQAGTDTSRAVTPAGLASRTATTSRTGVVELATDAEVQAGTDTSRAVTPAALSSRTATETRTGLVELASTAEASAGTDTDRAVTPAGLATVANTKADKVRTITAGTGLSGGGDLTADRTLSVIYGTTAGTAAQGNDARLSDSREWTAATISQAEAEAGTATTRRAWTSQRVRQAADAAIAAKNGSANGIASLDANAKIHLSQLPDSIVGQVEYMGLWNASTNAPTLSATPVEKGHYYVVSVSGTQFGTSFVVGDWIISNGASWDKVDNTDAVSSVNGRTGNVTGLAESNDPRFTDSREWTAATISQAEAEAGTATTRRAFTAQRVRQAIVAWFNGVSGTLGRTILTRTTAADVRSDIGLGTSATKNVATAAEVQSGTADKMVDAAGLASRTATETRTGLVEKATNAEALAGTADKFPDAAGVRAAIAQDAPTKTGTGASGTWGISITGNAATATKLATARTIGGVSFDGSANIDLPGVNAAGNQNTTGSAAKWTTARTITLGGDLSGSVSIDGSANVSLSAQVGNDSHSHTASTITAATTSVAGVTQLNDTVTSSLTTQAATANAARLAYNRAAEYAPSKTGANASGSWGISVTGNAATATKLATARTIGGVSFDGSANINLPGVNTAGNQNTTGSAAKWTTARTLTIGDSGKSVDGSGNVSWTRAEMGVPQMTKSTSVGIENAESCIAYVSNTLLGASDGALYSQVYSDIWKHQIQGDYRTGQIAVRGKNNGTWQDWRTVLDSGNYNNYSPTKTGTGASGSWGISITGNAATASSAAKWTTARTNTVTLTGDATGSGSASVDGSGNWTVTVNTTVNDDSHNHIIANVDGLQTALDGKLSTTGKAADSDKLDGLDSSQFLRSDASDTMTGELTMNNTISYNDVSRYWLRTATNWGMYWNTTSNRLEFHGSGVNRTSIDMDDGRVTTETLRTGDDTTGFDIAYNSTTKSLDFNFVG